MRHRYVNGKERHIHGWKPDRPDSRDLRLGIHWPWEHAAPLPDAVDLRRFCSRIENQERIGSCTANAATSCMEFLYLKAAVEQPELSRLFLYYASRVWIEGTPPTDDSGAQLRDVMTALAKYGTCTENTYAYLTEHFAERPKDEAIAEARHHRITKYLRCDGVAEIEQCLADGYPLVAGFSVPESMMSDEVAKTGDVPMPKGGESFVGGHAIQLVGYDRGALDGGAFLFANSWGKSWGAAGFGRLPYAYFKAGLAGDTWTIRSEEM